MRQNIQIENSLLIESVYILALPKIIFLGLSCLSNPFLWRQILAWISVSCSSLWLEERSLALGSSSSCDFRLEFEERWDHSGYLENWRRDTYPGPEDLQHS